MNLHHNFPCRLQVGYDSGFSVNAIASITSTMSVKTAIVAHNLNSMGPFWNINIGIHKTMAMSVNFNLYKLWLKNDLLWTSSRIIWPFFKACFTLNISFIAGSFDLMPREFTQHSFEHVFRASFIRLSNSFEQYTHVASSFLEE